MCSTTCQLQASNYFKLERGRMEIPLPLFPSSFLCFTRLRSVNADDWGSNAMDVVVPCIAPSSGRLCGLLQKGEFCRHSDSQPGYPDNTKEEEDEDDEMPIIVTRVFHKGRQ